MEECNKKFEELICELYRRKGYNVESQKTVIGVSGAKHRLDAICRKGKFFKKIVAVEAKYSTSGLPVSIDDFSRFLTAVEDCNIPEGHMITNSYFSNNIYRLAVTYNIKLIDGSQLRKELKKYGLSYTISDATLFLENFGIPIAKMILNYIDSSGTLSKILLPPSVLYIDFYRFEEKKQ